MVVDWFFIIGISAMICHIVLIKLHHQKTLFSQKQKQRLIHNSLSNNLLEQLYSCKDLNTKLKASGKV